MSKLFLFLVFILIANTALSQIQISGKVIDGDPALSPKANGLPGVNIFIRGTTIGTVTDSKGVFSFHLTDSQLKMIDTSKVVLVASFTGFQSTEVKYNLKKAFTTIEFSDDPGLLSKLKNANYAKSLIYFATDRNVTGSTLASAKFGAQRSTNSTSPISYGECVISIPRDHNLAEVERPQWWKFEFEEDPEKHIVILSTELIPANTFFSTLKTEIGKSSGKNALLFFHGYNVSFAEAARMGTMPPYC